ncbi:MAG: bacteriohemerythrin [Patescibacteria group bacterium]|nr:bacteriohemerythrin [Patescibacteria group bacterium]
MPIIKWEENFSVGVKEIDDQHKRIIEILNRIYKMISDNQIENSAVEQILKDLHEYADTHFSTEEIYFREFDYDKADSHIEAHDDYRRRVEEFRVKNKAGLAKETLYELSDFMNGWWVWHINNTDKEYTECFHRHGLY